MFEGYTTEERENLKNRHLKGFNPEQQEMLISIDETYKRLVAIEDLAKIRYRAPIDASQQLESDLADLELDPDLHPEHSYVALEQMLKDQLQQAGKLGLGKSVYIQKVTEIAYSDAA